MGEKRLNRRSRVAVGSRIDQLNTQRTDPSAYLLTGMVWSVVPKEDCVIPPTWRLAIKRLDQMIQEKRHHVAVSVGVAQSKPNPAIGVESSDHGKSRSHGLELDVARAVFRCPSSPGEAGLVEPSLV